MAFFDVIVSAFRAIRDEIFGDFTETLAHDIREEGCRAMCEDLEAENPYDTNSWMHHSWNEGAGKI